MIKRIIKGIRSRLSDPFWRNVGTLFSGSAMAQALPILFFPVITRLYTKEILGFYFVYAAIGMLSQIVASFQFQLAIILPKKKSEADLILALNFILVFIVSMAMGLIILAFFNPIKELLKVNEFSHWLYFVPISAFLLGMSNAVNYYFNRNKKYAFITYGKLSKSIVFSIFQLAFGFLGYQHGLITGLILGQIAGAVYLMYTLITRADFRWKFSVLQFKYLLHKYKDIPFFNTSISFLNTLSNQLPLFLLTRFFGVDAAGYYGLANRVVSTPMGLVGQSVGQVFYQEAAQIHNKKERLIGLVKTTYLRLFKIGIVPIVAIVFTAPWLFDILFGPDYYTSGAITRLLIPWLFIMFLNSPITYITTVLNKQRPMIMYDVFLLLFRFLALWGGYYFYQDLFISIGMFSAVGLVMNIFLLVYFIRISSKTNYEAYA